MPSFMPKFLRNLIPSKKSSEPIKNEKELALQDLETARNTLSTEIETMGNLLKSKDKKQSQIIQQVKKITAQTTAVSAAAQKVKEFEPMTAFAAEQLAQKTLERIKSDWLPQLKKSSAKIEPFKAFVAPTQAELSKTVQEHIKESDEITDELSQRIKDENNEDNNEEETDPELLAELAEMMKVEKEQEAKVPVERSNTTTVKQTKPGEIVNTSAPKADMPFAIKLTTGYISEPPLPVSGFVKQPPGKLSNLKLGSQLQPTTAPPSKSPFTFNASKQPVLPVPVAPSTEIPAAQTVSTAETKIKKEPLFTPLKVAALNTALNSLATVEIKDNGSSLEVKASQKLSTEQCQDLMKKTMNAIDDKEVTMTISGGSVEEIQAVLNNKELRDNKNINVEISDALLEKHPELKEIKEKFDEARENQQKSAPLDLHVLESKPTPQITTPPGAIPFPPPMIMSKGVDVANQEFVVKPDKVLKKQQLKEIRDVFNDVESVMGIINDDKKTTLKTITRNLDIMHSDVLDGKKLTPEQQKNLTDYSETINKFTAPPSKPTV